MNVYCDHCENVKKSIGKPKKNKKTKGLIPNHAELHCKTSKNLKSNQKKMDPAAAGKKNAVVLSSLGSLKKNVFWVFFGFPMQFCMVWNETFGFFDFGTFSNVILHGL